MDTFLFKINWYNDQDDEVYCSMGTIGAECYAEAVARIDKRFSDIDDIFVRRCFCADGFTFLNQNEWQRLMNEEDID